jgi:hypothetical protein
MYYDDYWTVGRGSKELDFFRQVLRRYWWVMEISLEEGGGTETWFPPADDRRRTAGISLHARNHGFWSTVGRDNEDIVEASPELLDRYLASIQPLGLVQRSLMVQ